MNSSTRFAVGVVVAKDRVDHPWAEVQWRPIEVHPDPPALAPGWIELRRLPDSTHYHSGPCEIVLHRNEVPGYIANLESGSPCIFVILRDTEDGEVPFEVHLVTPSNAEVQAYGESGAEIIGAVAMPPEILALVSAFVDQHYKEDKFVKRKRTKFDKIDEHTFGQEPIVELRRRMGHAAGGKDGTDDEQLR